MSVTSSGGHTGGLQDIIPLNLVGRGLGMFTYAVLILKTKSVIVYFGKFVCESSSFRL